MVMTNNLTSQDCFHNQPIKFTLTLQRKLREMLLDWWSRFLIDSNFKG